MLIKTPVVCLMLILYMLWFYYRKPHIPIKSTRIFQLLTGAALVNVLFDLITLYTVNHRDRVPGGVNLLAHIIYLLSILGYIFLLFLYLRSYLEVKLTFSKGIRVIQSLPFILSAIGILVLPITYVHGETTDYSLGPKAYALYGSIVVYLILKDIQREIKQHHLDAYRIGENGVVFIGNTKEKTEMALEGVKRAIEHKYGGENVSIATRLLWGEETDNKYKCMQNIIAFCTEIGQHFAYTDYLTHIYNRNAFERDLKKFGENSDGYYIIADLNNLKVVNDTIGHSAGDELLMSFAGLLNDAVGNDGRAYRQGGDEFAVLYRRDAQEFVRELEQKCKIYNLSRNVPISYAIGYCRLGEEDFVNVADSMMYTNKRKMKQ